MQSLPFSKYHLQLKCQIIFFSITLAKCNVIVNWPIKLSWFITILTIIEKLGVFAHIRALASVHSPVHYHFVCCLWAEGLRHKEGHQCWPDMASAVVTKDNKQISSPSKKSRDCWWARFWRSNMWVCATACQRQYNILL